MAMIPLHGGPIDLAIDMRERWHFACPVQSNALKEFTKSRGISRRVSKASDGSRERQPRAQARGRLFQFSSRGGRLSSFATVAIASLEIQPDNQQQIKHGVVLAFVEHHKCSLGSRWDGDEF